MPSRVDKLTPSQEKEMEGYAKKWIEIGLKTGETDWDTFDKYMPICYEKAKIAYPKNIVRVSSPMVGSLAAAVAEGILRKNSDAVGGAVDGAVRGAVDDAVGNAVGGAVRGAVRGAVGDAVDDAVKTAINIAKKSGVSISWHWWLGGQFWVGYGWYWGVAFVNFFFDICKLKLAKDIMERAEAYRKVCESVNYIWPNSDFVMVCARPKSINKDEQGRLHNPDGKSIEYPDGWGLYSWHGTTVSQKIIETPEKITKKDILKEKNAEVRRCMFEKLGAEKYAKLLGIKQINKGKRGVLYKSKDKDDLTEDYLYFVKVICPTTQRVYFLGTQEKKDADEAVARTFKMSKEKYNPTIET